MIRIDANGPQGNVFAVLGALKSVERQFRKSGCIEIADACANALKDCFSMKYDEILNKVEEVTQGAITFIRRDADDDADDDADTEHIHIHRSSK